MSFGLSRGKPFDTSEVFIDHTTFAPLPDDLLTCPSKAHLDITNWFAPARAGNPMHLEIGSGKGTFLVQEAPHMPEVNWIGIEYEREFCMFAADRIRRAQLGQSVKMLCVDASDFVHWRVPSRSLDVIHLYFPDPWPKTKHHRRRMIQDRFLADCARVLKPQGELRIATDHGPYWQWMCTHFDRWTGDGTNAERPFVQESFHRPVGARDGELVGTNFERKYRKNPGAGGGGTDFFATVLRLANAPKA
jgi:tRNA (guanine-N7-)-methyltransferase